MTEVAGASASALSRGMIELGGVEIEVYRGGHETAPCLVFLHGGEGFWPDAPFARALARRFRVVAPMHPGFGRSSLPSWMDSVDDFAYVHLSLIEHLGLKDVLLVGVSAGGWIAAQIAIKNTSRIARLVLASPVSIKVGGLNQLDVPDIFAMSRERLETLTYHDPAKWKFDPTGLSDEDLLTVARNWETLALVTWEPYMHDPKLKHRLYRIDRPTLLLRGESDDLVSAAYARQFASLIPDARLATIPAAGHMPHIEQPDAFADRVIRFAAR